MTVLTEKQQLREAVVANRRMLKLLDQQIDELAKLEPDVAAELIDPERHQPFTYVVEGIDKKAGIVIPVSTVPFEPPPDLVTGFQNPYYGYIRIQSDAAFVATRIFACVEAIPSVVDLGDDIPVRKNMDAPTSDAFWGISFRAYDEGAARWLLLANNRQQVQQAAAVPSPLFGQLPISSSGGLEIPTECVFPRNGLIRVEAYVQSFPDGTQSIADKLTPDLTRIYFLLHGYKVFGG